MHFCVMVFGDDVERLIGDAPRDHYEAQPAMQAIREGQQTLPPEQRQFLIDDALSGAREDYVGAAEACAGVTYALIFHGEWLDSDMVTTKSGRTGISSSMLFWIGSPMRQWSLS
jgi:hypothetical protein